MLLFIHHMQDQRYLLHGVPGAPLWLSPGASMGKMANKTRKQHDWQKRRVNNYLPDCQGIKCFINTGILHSGGNTNEVESSNTDVDPFAELEDEFAALENLAKKKKQAEPHQSKWEKL